MNNNWQTKKLGEVCKLKNGFAFKSDNYLGNGIPIIRISDIREGLINPQKAVKIDEKQEYDSYCINENDILVAMFGATTGKFGIYKSKEKAYQNQRVGKFEITDKSKLDNSFLLYQLHALKRQIEKDAYGGAQPNISSKKIEEMEIVVPDLATQQAIVSKIEELFSELDQGIAELKKAQEQLKTYRQSVLKYAFEGEWDTVNIKDVTTDIFAGGDKPKEFSEVRNEKFPYPIYANAVAKRGLYGFTNFARVKDDCVTIAGRGSGTGHLELRTEPFVPIVRLIVVVPKKDIITPQFLYYYLKNLTISITGSAIPQLTIPTVKEYSIAVPPLSEQQQIVQEIESRLSVADKMAETISESLQKAEALRQSVLKQAFSNQLKV